MRAGEPSFLYQMLLSCSRTRRLRQGCPELRGYRTPSEGRGRGPAALPEAAVGAAFLGLQAEPSWGAPGLGSLLVGQSWGDVFKKIKERNVLSLGREEGCHLSPLTSQP